MTIENELDKALQQLSKQNENYKKSLIDFIKNSRDILEGDDAETTLHNVLNQIKIGDSKASKDVSDSQALDTACCFIDLISRIFFALFGDMELLNENTIWPHGATNFLLLEKSRRLQVPFNDVKLASILQILIIYFSVLFYFLRTDRYDDFKDFLDQLSKYQRLTKGNDQLKEDISNVLSAITEALWGAYEVTNDGREMKIQIPNTTTKPSFLPNVIAFDKSLYRVIPDLQMKLLKGLAGGEKTVVKTFIETVTGKKVNDLSPEVIDVIENLIRKFYKLLKKDLGSYASLTVVNLFESFDWAATVGATLLENVGNFLQKNQGLQTFLTLYQDQSLSKMEPDAVIPFCKAHPEYFGVFYFSFNLRNMLSVAGGNAYNGLLRFLENFSADPEFEETKNTFFDEKGNFYLQWLLLGRNKEYLSTFKKFVRIIVVAIANLAVDIEKIYSNRSVGIQDFLAMLLQPLLNVVYALIFASVFQYVVSPIFELSENYIVSRHAVTTSGVGILSFLMPNSGGAKSKNLNKFIEKKLGDKAAILKYFLVADIWIANMGCFKEPREAFSQLWNSGINVINTNNFLDFAKIKPQKSIEKFDLDGVFLGMELKKYLESVINTADELRQQDLAMFLIFPNIKRKVIEKFRDKIYGFDISKVSVTQTSKTFAENFSATLLQSLKEYNATTQARHIEEYISKNEDTIAEAIADVLYYHLSGIFVNAEIKKLQGRFTREEAEIAKNIFNANKVVDNIEKVFSLKTSDQVRKAKENIGLLPTYKDSILNIASLVSSNNTQKLKEELPKWLGSSNARQLGTVAFFEIWEIMDSLLPEPAANHSAFYTKDSCYCYEKTGDFGNTLKSINNVAAFISYIPEALRDGVFQVVNVAFQWITDLQSQTQSFTKLNTFESTSKIFDMAKTVANFLDTIIDYIQAVFNPRAAAIAGILSQSFLLTLMQSVEECLVKKG